jgi:hypothetical protein
MERLYRRTLIEIIFNPIYQIFQLVANPDEFFPIFVHILRFELAPHENEPWCRQLMNSSLTEYPLFVVIGNSKITFHNLPNLCEPMCHSNLLRPAMACYSFALPLSSFPMTHAFKWFLTYLLIQQQWRKCKNYVGSVW